MAKKILLLSVMILVYSFIWAVLEIVLYGQVEPRIVDDIMMILFLPIFWKAVENITI